MPPPPTPFKFTVPSTLSAFSIPVSTYLASHPQYAAVASGVFVFAHENGQEKILLLQRASHDFMPNRWETPGGAVDPEDETILHGVARELWEEAGLVVKGFKRQVGEGYSFQIAKELCWLKLNFLVDVERGEEEKRKVDGEVNVPEVTIDLNEHQKFVWASEVECRRRKVGSLEIEFTSQKQEETILEEFRVRKAERGHGV